ncbi:MAG: hypothetical protein WBD50_07105, partial [Candidatus Rhabdochlamydia sp.]
EKWNYQIQYQIFNYLDKTTEQTKWLRPPAFLAFGVSSLAYFTTRTLSVLELTIHGLVLSSSSENRARGWILLKRAPCQVGNLVAILPNALINAITIIGEPKFYILSNSEHMKVNRIHLEAGTIGTQPYEIDSQRAIGKAN